MTWMSGDVVRDLVPLWFAVSVLVEVVGNLAFLVWLRRRTPVRMMWVGTPGYLDFHYVRWCRTRGVSPRMFVGLRVASLVNVVAACVTLFATLR